MSDGAEILSGALGHGAVLNKPRDAVKKNIYRFYQAASLYRYYVLRELLPKHNLAVV